MVLAAVTVAVVTTVGIPPLIERSKTGAAIKPAQQRSVRIQGPDKGRRFAGEIGEDALGHIASEIGRTGLTQGRRVNRVRVTHDDVAERGFPAVFSVIAQQLGIGRIAHLTQ